MTLVLLIAVLATSMVVYVAVVGFITPPQWSLYAYLALWLIVPKALRLTYLTGGAYDFPEGVTAFNALEVIAVLGIVVALLVHRKQPVASSAIRPLKWLSLLLLGSGVFALVVSLGALAPLFSSSVADMSKFLGQTVEVQYRILPVLSMLYAVVFLFGCARFIRTSKHIEPFFWLLALSGVELALERIFFVNLHLFSGLQQYTIESSGRFGSLVFTNFDAVGVFAILSLCSSLYLALRGRRVAWLMFAAAWIPILASYQRAVLLGALAAVVFVYCAFAKRRNLVLVLPGVVLVAATLLITGADRSLLQATGQSLGGEARPDYFATDQLDVRLAFWIRAIDVFEFDFPAGTGPGAASAAMNYPIPGADAPQNSPLSNAVYTSIASDNTTHDTHNDLLKFLVEHGVFGILVIGVFLFVVVRLLAGRLRQRDVADVNGAVARTAQVCSLAVLVGVGVEGLFTITPLPYFVYFLFAYVAVVSGEIGRRAREPLAPRALPASRESAVEPVAPRA